MVEIVSTTAVEGSKIVEKKSPISQRSEVRVVVYENTESIATQSIARQGVCRLARSAATAAGRL